MITLEQNIQISELGEHTEWVPTVALWLHREWMRSASLSLDLPDFDIRYAERKAALEAHLVGGGLPITFVAHDGESPIGTISLVYYTFTQKQQPSEWVTNLFVLPSYRRQGIASSLLNAAVNYAKTLGKKRLLLYTRDQAGFYTKRDWRLINYGSVQGHRVSIFDYSIESY